MDTEERLQRLRELLFDRWDEDPGALAVGTSRGTCPECGNGAHGDNAFALTVSNDASEAAWCCHRATCGFAGRVAIWRGDAASGAAAAAAARASGAPGGVTAWTPQAGAAPAAAPAAAPGWSSPAGAGAGGGLQQPQPPQPLGLGVQALSRDLLDWFAGRGISKATLARNDVGMEARWCSGTRQVEDHIAFRYYKHGLLVNIKYRALPKHFSQSKGGQQVFYGYDDAVGADEVIIVEGEMDKLAIEEALVQLERTAGSSAAATGAGEEAPPPLGSGPLPAPLMTSPHGGRRAVVSVPAGAPNRGSGGPGSSERKFKFLDDCSDILTSARRVVLAVDSDGPGVVLAGELARRLGRERCLIVSWPTSRETSLADPKSAASAAGDWARKDANEVLVKDGSAVLKAYVDAAKPLPIRGLFRFNDFWEQVYDLYQQGPKGLSWGVSTGWQTVDTIYKVVPGELTVVTGLPNSGKSEWLDALAVNLAQLHGWRIGLCSLENVPKEHGRKLMEKYTGKAFFEAEYSHGTTKLGYKEVLDAIGWIDEHFQLIVPPRDQMPTIDFILQRARAAVLRYGINGLIIDPYNELDHRRPGNLSETEHVSRLLTRVKRFAQHYDCHVWFVAHPRTQRGMGIGGGTASLNAPSMYDISGSANFINKADNGIVVHRPHTGRMAEAEGRDTQLTQILVRKVRNKLAGRIGDAVLSYDRATGRYVELPQS